MKYLARFSESFNALAVVFALSCLFFVQSGHAAGTVINEPGSFSWTAVTTDADGDPVDAGRVTGYEAICASEVGHQDVSLSFPGAATETAIIAPGTFALGVWDCLLSAVDSAPGAPAPLSAAASFEVTMVVTLAPLSAPATYEVTFTATPN